MAPRTARPAKRPGYVAPAPDDDGTSCGDKACEKAGTSSITGRGVDRDAGRRGRAKSLSAMAIGVETIALRNAVSTTEVGAGAATDDLAEVVTGGDFGETGSRRTVGLVSSAAWEVRTEGTTTEAMGATGAMIGATAGASGATGAGTGAMIGATAGASGATGAGTGAMIGATAGATRPRTAAMIGATAGATRARNAAMIGATTGATRARTGATGAMTGVAVVVVAVCVIGALAWMTGVAVVAAGVVGVGDDVAGTGWAGSTATARGTGSIAWVGGATA
jgi:hypothetical protein